MAAPLGNKNGRGNHNSGRKSAYAERISAETLAEMYFKKHSQEEIEQAIHTGKFSIQERHILNALEGDQKAIEGITKKLFPDLSKTEHSGEVKAKIISVDE